METPVVDDKRTFKKLKKKIKFLSYKFFTVFAIVIILISMMFFSSHGFIANKNNYSKNTAYKYSNFGIQGTSWLSFRDIPDFIKDYVNGKDTLDFGCGAGRSTRFLKSLGLKVTGVDISQEFIDQAYRIDKLGNYKLMKKDKIPFNDNSFDFVFSSHVLLMIPTKKELNDYFKEAHRVLKKDGILIAVTGSENMHDFDKNWLSYNTNFPENIAPKNGAIVKVEIKDVGAIFYDYNWTNKDYLEFIKNNNFKVIKIHYPLGKKNEKYAWLSEKQYSPYIVYILKKV